MFVIGNIATFVARGMNSVVETCLVHCHQLILLHSIPVCVLCRVCFTVFADWLGLGAVSQQPGVCNVGLKGESPATLHAGNFLHCCWQFRACGVW